MTDGDGQTRDLRPDDDRLLAFVLGLADDADLEAEALTDTALGRQVDELRLAVDAVAAQVDRAVPLPDETYTDLGVARWEGLRPYLEAVPPAPPVPLRPRGTGARWLRILAPAAALVLAVGIGAAVLRSQSGSQSTSANKTVTAAAAPTPSSVSVRAGGRSLDMAAARDFAVILVARARRAHNGYQWFDVVRVLRGTAPQEVRLHVETRPALADVFHVVFLSPRTSEETTAGTSPGTGSATPPAATLAFSRAGADALVMQLAADVAPQDVALPQP